MYGCTKDSELTSWADVDGSELRRCPLVVLSSVPWLSDVLSCERFLSEFHVLPYTGGVLDQPAALMDALEYLAGQRARHERKKLVESEARH